MEFTPTYAIGQTLWTVKNCKAISFKVAIIAYDGTQCLYGESVYDLLPESECFATKEALINHIAEE